MRIISILTIIMTMSLAVYGGKQFCHNQNYQIITPENPTKIEQFAAAELKKFLNKSFTKPIILNGSSDKIRFIVGFSSEAMLAGFDNIPDMSNRFGIFRKKRTFLFFGDDSRNLDPTATHYYKAGTLSAVYYFINRYLKTDFFFPGENGYRITVNPRLQFTGTSDIPKPDFTVRGIALNTREYSAGELNIFYRRLLGNEPWWSRYDYYYIYWKKWKKRFSSSHPEYFAMYDGRRISENYPRHVPCFSNHDALLTTAADIIQAINRNPDIKSVRVFCDAPIQLCCCKKCLAAAERKYCGGELENGEAVYGWQYKIMKLVHEAWPHIQFITQTKGLSYYHPPRLVKLGDSFTVKILTERELPEHDFSPDVKLAQAWRRNGVKLLLKSYPRYPAFKNYPIIKPHLDQKFLKQFAGIVQGATDSDLRSYVPYAFTALGQYLQLKMLFNLNVDIDREITKFCAFAYPGAAKEMVKFYAAMEKLFAENNSLNDNMFMKTYYPDKLKIPMQLLDAAAVKTDRSAPRFRKLYAAFKKFYQQALKAKARVDLIWAAAPLKKLHIPLLKTAAKIQLQHPETWQGALKTELFAADLYHDFQKSTIYLGCSKKYLYIGLKAAEKAVKFLKQSCTVNGKGAIWRDDCFEIMLVPNADKNRYFQIIVNSRGVYRIFKCQTGRTSTDARHFPVTTIAKIGSGYWLAAVKIPLSNFRTADFSGKWKINIFRTRVLKNKNGKSHQSSGLRLLGGSYHDLSTYDILLWPAALTGNAEQ